MNYSWGIGRHGQKQGGAILPEMMRWLWRDHPVSTDAERHGGALVQRTGPAQAWPGLQYQAGALS